MGTVSKFRIRPTKFMHKIALERDEVEFNDFGNLATEWLKLNG